jgi:hypothetical protein
MSTIKHHVVFSSPGSFMDEQSAHDIAAWDVKVAVEHSRTVEARYGAKPFAFQFVTADAPEERVDDGRTWRADVRELARSGWYFLGADILSADDVKARAEADPKRYGILWANMQNHRWQYVAETKTPYLHCAPFDPAKDANVDPVTGDVIQPPQRG